MGPHGWFCAGMPFARMTSYAFVSFAAMSSIRISPVVMSHWMYAVRESVGGKAAAGAELPSVVSKPTAAVHHALAPARFELLPGGGLQKTLIFVNNLRDNPRDNPSYNPR